MFNKIKHLKDLRSQGKQLQNALAAKTVTVEQGGISLTLDGNQNITALTINPNLTAAEIEKILPGLLKDGLDKIKRIMAETMQGMGGLDNFKL
ncbi:YbaB/EbfC family nucleoid-associated protein [Candidatus Falkowbacteria bacterium]|nr:YbaB/EbfC family nucleoid-associated protein [Candidatus Falkowbacteria bacterium]